MLGTKDKYVASTLTSFQSEELESFPYNWSYMLGRREEALSMSEGLKNVDGWVRKRQNNRGISFAVCLR